MIQVVEHDGRQFDLSDRDQRIEYGIEMLTPKIRGLARLYKNTISQEEDFVQEAMLKIVQVNNDNIWNPEKKGAASYTTFLYKCIQNALLDVAFRDKFAMSVPSGSIKSVKSQNRIRGISLSEDLPDERGNVYEHIDLHDTLENFDHCRIGEMYFQERRTMKEIAQITGFSVSKVSRIINRIQELLQSRLAVV